MQGHFPCRPTCPYFDKSTSFCGYWEKKIEASGLCKSHFFALPRNKNWVKHGPGWEKFEKPKDKIRPQSLVKKMIREGGTYNDRSNITS
jgi:hypothetical protein